MYWLWVSRFIAGMGIGGEYAAINSAIDELIPAKYRGQVDIAVNGTYWGGAFLGTDRDAARREQSHASYSWRVAFLTGPCSASSYSSSARIFPRAHVGSSCTEKRKRQRAQVKRIEEAAQASGGSLGEVDESKAIEVAPATNIGFIALARTLFVTYPRRAILGATLMITQSFLYNAIFFTYALVLTKVYGVSSKDTPYYFMFFALGNLIGPLTLGRLFDTVGRRRMISGTYILAGTLLIISAFLFDAGALNADNPDRLLVCHLLLRLLRRQCRLPDGQ